MSCLQVLFKSCGQLPLGSRARPLVYALAEWKHEFSQFLGLSFVFNDPFGEDEWSKGTSYVRRVGSIPYLRILRISIEVKDGGVILYKQHPSATDIGTLENAENLGDYLQMRC